MNEQTKEILKLGLAAVIGGLLAIILYSGILKMTANMTVDQDTTTVIEEVLVGENISISGIVEETSPAVVQISRSNSQGVESLGSGVIVDASLGYVVTCYHVVAEYGDLTVNLLDGRVTTASRVGSDPNSDLAVLKLQDTGSLTAIELGDSTKLKVGQTAIAIGSPLSLDYANTVTLGIISGLDRDVTYTLDTGDEVVLTTLQTDAAINPGNCGGALLNSLGQLIGINNVKVSADNVEGLGFAIPVNTVKAIVEEIINTGGVDSAYLGVGGLVTINRSTADYYGIPAGVLVGEVAADSPASKAGIRINDIITRVGDTQLESSAGLRKALNSLRSGDRVEVEIFRSGRTLKYSLTLE